MLDLQFRRINTHHYKGMVKKKEKKKPKKNKKKFNFLVI